MQNRNFAIADYDNNGKIENKEFYSLKNSVKDVAKNQNLSRFYEAVTLKKAISTQGYQASSPYKESISINGNLDSRTKQGSFNYSSSKQSLSLDDLINESIRMDKNLDGTITRLEYVANGQSDEKGYEEWATKALYELLDEDSRKKIQTLVVDHDHTITQAFDGMYSEDIRNYYDSNGLRNLSGASGLGLENLASQTDRIETEKIDNMLDTDLVDEKDSLVNEFPEFKTLIENNENISRSELLKLIEQNKASKEYTKNSQDNLQTQFNKAMFQTDLNI
ncbi:hypothetical protein [Campylobacter sp. LR196d]|uniref:hypothetical protein n=1 Tax=Campylobacter sp. LR196d TaxID=2593543 RepID=UPI001680DFE8|nr:hypothetical protein [Campylobacter sp. LR196d]